MRDDERLEALLRVLDDLVEASRSSPVLVEGDRDVVALRSLGVEGEVLVINRGVSLVQLADEVARHHRAVVLLTDWDRKGGILARRLRELLEILSVRVDIDIRRRLARLSHGEVRTVEALPALYSNAVRRTVPGIRPDRGAWPK
ncbi:MAG: topoisomerase [Thermoplasmata archaeon]|nr:topoisomerase [Thermoplasmata archaeon]